MAGKGLQSGILNNLHQHNTYTCASTVDYKALFVGLEWFITLYTAA